MKKHSKFIASAAAITVAAATIIPVASAASFSDIKGHSHENAIMALVNQGIINGYPDGTFRPNQSLSRSDVVKLLGKYLVSLGHTVPTDYKTKMRFTDLTAKSQDELLQYAALVKDVGVFNGSNGALMHKDEIRRDQMATVLVRAFKVIHDYDYIAHVKEQGYTPVITDLAKTTAEHQEAINVFSFYGVTKQATFSPKDVTKRGQFASFLNNMLKIETPAKEPEKPVLTVKTVEVQAADKLRVVLSDDKAYIITLKTPLLENIATEVSFEIGEKTYKTTVKYEVPDLKIATVTNDNGGQVKITFNQPVKLDASLNTAAISKLVTLTGVDKLGVVQLLKGSLSEDKRTLMVTTNSVTGLDGRYRLVVEGITSETGKILAKYDEIISLVGDKIAPAIVAVENVTATKVKVVFSEPINNPVGVTQFKLADGTVVNGIRGTIEKNATEVIYDLSAATARGVLLAPGTVIVVTFGTIIDLANNLSSPNPLTTTITKGDKDGIVPTLLNVTQLGAKKFKLTFSEELRTIAPSDIVIAQNTYTPAITSVTVDSTDAKSYIVTTNGYLSGYTTIATAPGKFITDVSGEATVFSTAYNFQADMGLASVTGSAVVTEQGEEYLEFTFDRNVEIPTVATVALSGSYVYQGYTMDLANKLIAPITKHPKNDKIVRVKLSALLGTSIAAGTMYYVNTVFSGLQSEYGQAVNNTTTAQFVRGIDSKYTEEKIALLKVETSSNADTTTVIDNNQIILTFSTAVDGVAASNTANYFINGVTVERAMVRAEAPNKVILTLKSNSIYAPIGEMLTVSNMRASGSVVPMDTANQLVYLKENIGPTYHAVNVTALNTVVLTFSETMKNVLADSFIVYMNNVPVKVNRADIIGQSNNQVALQLETQLVAGRDVTIQLANNIPVSDSANNLLNMVPVTFTVPVGIFF